MENLMHGYYDLFEANNWLLKQILQELTWIRTDMDKKIAKIQSINRKEARELKELKTMDKKQDKKLDKLEKKKK